MKNKLSDLNNHLFAQLERLGDEDLKGDDLKEEIERSRAIEKIGHIIVENAELGLKAMRFASDSMNQNDTLPPMLETK